MKYTLLVVFTFLVLVVPISGQSTRYARVISENANLRETPAVAGTATQEIPEETLVKVLDEKLPWYVVRIGNRVGWMHGDTLEFITTGTSEQKQDYSPAPYLTSPGDSTREQRTAAPTRSGASGGAGGGGYIRGPRGGCYYISGSGRKVYVDRSMCN